MKRVRLGLLGVGTVGRGVVDVLNRNGDEILRRTGYEVIVSAASARNLENASRFLGQPSNFTRTLSTLLKMRT
jgi:homoserine dehydrogenase